MAPIWPVPSRRPIHIGTVHEHKVTVPRLVYVALNSIRAGGNAGAESGQRVLGRQAGGATMTDATCHRRALLLSRPRPAPAFYRNYASIPRTAAFGVGASLTEHCVPPGAAGMTCYTTQR